MQPRKRWGLLGTGAIARTFAKALPRSETGLLKAVASRSQDKADSFAKEFEIESAYGSYEDLLASPDVDVVYIATPHSQHAAWAIKAAAAGKHILCEKPIAINTGQAIAIADAARANKVFLMEAFMYRCHPQTAKLTELIRNGEIGDVRMIRASFAFNTELDPEHRLFDRALGGGGILDVGCYPVSMARLIAGAALNRMFVEPIEVTGAGALLPETGVDGHAAALLRFPGDIIAQVSTGIQLAQENDLTVYGSKGRIHVPSPWFCTGREGGSGSIFIHREDGEMSEIAIDCNNWLYALEADIVGNALALGKTESNVMPIEDTLGNMSTLDRWREAIGLTYNADQQ